MVTPVRARGAKGRSQGWAFSGTCFAMVFQKHWCPVQILSEGILCVLGFVDKLQGYPIVSVGSPKLEWASIPTQ